MSCTFIVDSFSFVENQQGDRIISVYTPGDKLEKILSQSSLTNNSINFNNSWNQANNFLLHKWLQKKLLTIITPDQFDAAIHKNPFYIINVGSPMIGLNPLVSNLIPESTAQLLRENNAIKILFFSPYDYYEHYIQTWGSCSFHFYCQGINNKICILSLTRYTSTENGRHITNNISNGTENILHYYAVTFLGEILQKQLFKGKSFINDQPMNCTLTHRKNKLFLCLNNAVRNSRLLLLQALHSKNLIAGNIVSKTTEHNMDLSLFASLLNKEQHIHADAALKFLSHANSDSALLALINSNQQSLQTYAGSLVKTIAAHITSNSQPPQRFVDTINQTGSSGNMNYNQYFAAEWYEQTWCSVITETYYQLPDGVESPMITEKTLKPILNCHPFVIFGHAHSHTMLQQLGFKTFEQSWFGLPPDGAVGNRSLLERLSNLIESLERLSNMSNDELSAKWQTIVPDLIFNHNHCRNTDWNKLQIELLTGDRKILE